MGYSRYQTSRWKRLRAQFLRANPTCYFCGLAGRVVPATTVDHATPLSVGGAFYDIANLRAACAACNFSKRGKTEAEFHIKGCGVDGLPLDPKHFWNRPRPGNE